MAIWGAVIGAVASLAGSALGFKGAQEQNVTNLEISKRQMDFQERMSSTSFQRGMDDMRAAGLNPILAYKQGGAAAPAGASIPAVNELGEIDPGGAVQSALAAKTAVQNLKVMQAQEKNIRFDTQKKSSEAALNWRESANKNLQYSIMQEGLTSAKASAEGAKTTKKFFETDLGKLMRKIDIIGRSINPFASATSKASRLGR